jgi:hypothetical protein
MLSDKPQTPGAGRNPMETESGHVAAWSSAPPDANFRLAKSNLAGTNSVFVINTVERQMLL